MPDGRTRIRMNIRVFFRFGNSSDSACYTTMGSDDFGPTQGPLSYNHPDIVVFLFVDGHSAAFDQNESEFEDLMDPLGN